MYKGQRLDPPGTSPVTLLKSIKTLIAAGLPSMFGFTVYSSMPFAGVGHGDIPFPGPGDSQQFMRLELGNGDLYPPAPGRKRGWWVFSLGQ